MLEETAGDDINKVINKIIGRNIYLHRTMREWTPEHLGRRLEVTAQEVQAYESGDIAVPLAELKALSKLFGCTIDDLATDSQMELALILERPHVRTFDKVKWLIKNFLSIEKPDMQDHICRMVLTIVGMKDL
jgi:transcriptional regulator with XRE-family HTH domain